MPKRPLTTANRDKGAYPLMLVAPGHESPEAPRPIDPLLYSVNAAAHRLGVSESTIWRLIDGKKLYPTRVRSRTMISETELQRYVAESTVRP
jgi:excisionase family DNA binding protein